MTAAMGGGGGGKTKSNSRNIISRGAISVENVGMLKSPWEKVVHKLVGSMLTLNDTNQWRI